MPRRAAEAAALCRVCGELLPGDRVAADRGCPGCGHPLAEGDPWVQARRAAGVVLGILVQLLTGVAYFAFPPGSSPGAWLLYVALGAGGFLWMFVSARAWRSAGRSERTIAETALFEPGDIPYHAKSCRRCGQSLEPAVRRGRRRCPHCGAHFSLRDLGWRDVDHAGEPATLSPNERRLPGAVVAVLLFVALLAVMALVTLIAAPASPTGPGP